MLGLFKKSIPKPQGLSQEDIEWIEQVLAYCIEVFGIERVRASPFIIPDVAHFPYNNLQEDSQFDALLLQLCHVYEIDSSDIAIRFFDDVVGREWTTLLPAGNDVGLTSSNHRLLTNEAVRFHIEVAVSTRKIPQRMVAVLSRELAQVKLIKSYLVNTTQPWNYGLIDIIAIYFGFGIVAANSYIVDHGFWLSQTGFLSIQHISYVNALICYLSDKPAASYLHCFNANGRELFKKNWDYLMQTGNTQLTNEEVELLNLKYVLAHSLNAAFAAHDFDNVLALSARQLELADSKPLAYNNMGYALIKQKDYKKAIDCFTKAVDLDPHFDYAFNNRGYCRLNLGDLDGGLTDIESALLMNRENAYAHRNMGFYYFLIGEFAKAIESFDTARKLDPNTELIHYFLSNAHQQVDNHALATSFLAQSIQLKEYNDSSL